MRPRRPRLALTAGEEARRGEAQGRRPAAHSGGPAHDARALAVAAAAGGVHAAPRPDAPASSWVSSAAAAASVSSRGGRVAPGEVRWLG